MTAVPVLCIICMDHDLSHRKIGNGVEDLIAAFMEAYCADASEDKRRRLEKLCSTLVQLTGGDPERIADMRLEEICSLFKSEKGNLSKTPFYRTKSFLLALSRYFAERGYDTERFTELLSGLRFQDIVEDQQFSMYYYRDLRDLDDKINQTAEAAGLAPDETLLDLKAVVHLVWFGIELEEILKIRKDALRAADQSLCLPESGGRVFLDAADFQIVQAYAQAADYRSFPSGERKTYARSALLFRTSGADRMRNDGVSMLLFRFNAYAVQLGYQLSLPRIKRNVLYCKIYELELSGMPLHEAIRTGLHEGDRAAAAEFKKHYLKWKRCYHGMEA